MDPKNLFKLEKLKIYVKDTDKKTIETEPSFEVMFNPESFKTSHGNVFQKKPTLTPGSDNKKANYTGSTSDKLALTLILDSTGSTDFGVSGLIQKIPDVRAQVNRFLKACFRIEGKKHEPNHLQIRWGIIHFNCVLESVEIKYTSFDKSGMPLRAQLDTVFLGDRGTVTDLDKEEPSSPDLSHTRIVKQGDTLPLLTKDIYGSAKYYLRVAQANGLDNFRNLTPGQEIIFPPLEK
jgi:nucleoid-associated protein YgaU